MFGGSLTNPLSLGAALPSLFLMYGTISLCTTERNPLTHVEPAHWLFKADSNIDPKGLVLEFFCLSSPRVALQDCRHWLFHSFSLHFVSYSINSFKPSQTVCGPSSMVKLAQRNHPTSSSSFLRRGQIPCVCRNSL